MEDMCRFLKLEVLIDKLDSLNQDILRFTVTKYGIVSKYELKKIK